MKRVLFDHNVPGPLESYFGAHEVRLADALGWAELKNGAPLTEGEQTGFDVLLSGEQTIRHEQNMTGRRIALVYMSDNHWPIVKEYAPTIVQAVEQVKPGEVRSVYCGTFVPRKFRKSSGTKA